MSFSRELNKISVSWSTIMQVMQLIRTLGVLFWFFFLCVADYPGNTISYIRAFSRGLSLRDGLSLGNGKGNIFLDINS